jgi:hypothetical protein
VNLVTYAEDLPPSCPPGEAKDVPLEVVYRFLTSDAANAREFRSHAAQGKPNRTNVDPCSFASCSLLADFEKYLTNLPNMRKAHTHVARLQIPEGVGRSNPKKKNGTVHFDFWCYAGQSLADCVEEVLPIPPEEKPNA